MDCIAARRGVEAWGTTKKKALAKLTAKENHR
jgi:hypothetical protein